MIILIHIDGTAFLSEMEFQSELEVPALKKHARKTEETKESFDKTGNDF